MMMMSALSRPTCCVISEEAANNNCIVITPQILYIHYYNKRKRIPKGHSKMDNLRKKLATQDTICVGHHYIQANTNKVDKT